jgi:glycyl-tRNA synthetase
LAILVQAYEVEKLENGERVVLHLPIQLAPYQVAVMPLQKQLNEQAYQVYQDLLVDFNAVYDETGNVGKRYRRQDAIGTPFVVTYDFDSLNDHKVTVRERDSMKQDQRILIKDLKMYFEKRIKE